MGVSTNQPPADLAIRPAVAAKRLSLPLALTGQGRAASFSDMATTQLEPREMSNGQNDGATA